ncbi:MAG: TolC family protein, partial [Planctomycetota bacterium]|nr:TolC family protein [Planctomycetota bacterium]
SLIVLASTGCISTEEHVARADERAYGILNRASQAVTGEAKTFDILRPVDTLRERLKISKTPVVLDLKSALDVAAENSRDYQRQKETLYRAALSLSGEQHEFETHFGSSGSADISGSDDSSAQVRFREALSASVNTESGGRLVASFATTFLRSIINGDSLDGTSILGLTFTQPLLRGFGPRIVRENLTQSERNVVYAMRDFERSRSTLALRIVQDYYRVLSLMDNLKNTRINHQSLVRDRIRMVMLVLSNRQRAEDLDQAKQRELVAENSVLSTAARLENSLDQFKITLGLPADSQLALDPREYERLQGVTLESAQLVEDRLVAFALGKRMDYRSSRDREADAARSILVAEDALRSILNFSAALDVPTEGSNKPFNIDWDKVSWSAGFDLDLALDRYDQANAYRRALISYAQAQRSTEQLQDEIKRDIRDTIRTLKTLEKSYAIDQAAVTLAERRVKRTEAFMLAGGRNRTETRDVLEAKDDLLAAQLSLTGSLVDFAVAKLQLLRDLESLPLEPKGLRYDPGLEIPKEALHPPTRSEEPREDKK